MFDDVELSEAQILLKGAEALNALQAALAIGRVAVSAQLTGIAKGCLEQTVTYVNQRVQFGRPIGSFQSIKHRCVDLLIEVELADACWREAARQLDSDEQDCIASVCAAKARSSDVARKVGKEAVQMHGAMGFTEECDVGLFLRAALQLSGWLGSPHSMRRQFLTVTESNLLHAEVANG